MGLRYRYFVWLDKTFNKFDDIIEDRSGIYEFTPQDEYSLSDQVLLIVVTPLSFIAACCHKLNERLSVTAEKLKVSSNSKDETQGEKQ